ncbi:MAG: response regulator transcription factor [Gammaproteobacteria bacterium]|nr:response regulator transcription factor [Gammaproteobacteria bacterium]
MSPSSVLIVEDDTPTANRVAHVIETHDRFNLIGVATNCADAKIMFREQPADVVVLDIGLPDGDGKQLIPEFKQLNPNACIIMLSAFDDPKNVIDAITFGANGYILKDAANEDIALLISQMLEGGAPISPQIATHILKLIRKPEKVQAEDAAKLSDKEQEILILISKGYSYSEISNIIKLKYNTVASYIKNIYRKLDVSSRCEAVYEAQSQGLIDETKFRA